MREQQARTDQLDHTLLEVGLQPGVVLGRDAVGGHEAGDVAGVGVLPAAVLDLVA